MTIKEVDDWINAKYSTTWKSAGTAPADMVPKSLGGNNSSNVSDEYRVLERVSPIILRVFKVVLKNGKAKMKNEKVCLLWYCLIAKAFVGESSAYFSTI